MTVVGLVAFARTKRFAPFCRGQLLMMLALPVLLQASLGGFRESSAVALWAVTAPLGALLFEGVRRALPWFAAFAAAMIGSALLETSLTGEGDVPDTVVVAFFVLNVLGVSTTMYLLIRYFIGEREGVLAALQAEQDRSEQLLLNVLPATIAQRLKEGPGVIADAHDEVTVLFADVVGFTAFAHARPPAEVVGVLNQLFSAFDELADRHGLEKIKTIGDSYMAVGGLPLADIGHRQAVAEMALDLCDVVDHLRAMTGADLAVRVGIDSGPVVAGVIGRRRFSYDVWGDTVNMASRMESQGLPGCIQVTGRSTNTSGTATSSTCAVASRSRARARRPPTCSSGVGRSTSRPAPGRSVDTRRDQPHARGEVHTVAIEVVGEDRSDRGQCPPAARWPGWVRADTIDERGGHPWVISGEVYAARLRRLTGAPVRPR